MALPLASPDSIRQDAQHEQDGGCHEEGCAAHTAHRRVTGQSVCVGQKQKRPGVVKTPRRMDSESLNLFYSNARMAKLVDAAVFKTDSLQGICGFESRYGHTTI